MSGVLLWLRRTEFLALAAVGAVLLCAINLLLAKDTSGGDTLSTRGLWNATLIGLTVGLVLRPETPVEVAVPRSLRLRRAALLGGVLLYSLLSGLVFLHAQPFDGGMLAQWRNTLGLSGLTMLSGCLLGRGLVWVLPLAAVTLAHVFTYPSFPSTLDTAVHFLKADGRLRTPEGALDLSWAVSLTLCCAGGALYLLDLRSTRRWAQRRSRIHLSEETIAAGIMALSVLGATLSRLPEWEGSARILLARMLPASGFILVPVAAALACYLSQRRHRCGWVPWERIAPRGQARACAAASLRSVAVVCGSYAAASLLLVVPNLPLRDARPALAQWFLAFAWVAVGTLAGCLAGWLLRYWPATPLLGIACFIAVLLTPAPPANLRYVDPAARQPAPYCQGDATQVCGSTDNAEQIDALAAVTATEYRRSGLGAVLPARLLLIDDGAEQPRTEFAYLGRSQLAQRGISPGSFWELLAAENGGRCLPPVGADFTSMRSGKYPATSEERAEVAGLVECVERSVGGR